MYESIRFYRQIATPVHIPRPAPAFDAATTAWIAAVVGNGGSVSGARQTVVNNLIVGLKADGIWTKLDRLWLFAGENEPSALTDLVALDLAAKVSTPTFTTDTGFAGEDTGTPTKYINLTYNPSTDGVQGTTNSIHLSAWSATNAVDSNGFYVGCTDASTAHQTNINGGRSTNTFWRPNDSPASAGQTAVASTRGFFLANRSGAALSQGYYNGSLSATINQAAGTIPNVTAYACCHQSAGNPDSGSQNTIAEVSYGGSLDGTDNTNFYNRLRTYMTAVGVP